MHPNANEANRIDLLTVCWIYVCICCRLEAVQSLNSLLAAARCSLAECVFSAFDVCSLAYHARVERIQWIPAIASIYGHSTAGKLEFTCVFCVPICRWLLVLCVVVVVIGSAGAANPGATPFGAIKFAFHTGLWPIAFFSSCCLLLQLCL